MSRVPGQETVEMQSYGKPFVPERKQYNSNELVAAYRAVHALEYIAAQLGMIREQLTNTAKTDKT